MYLAASQLKQTIDFFFFFFYLPSIFIIKLSCIPLIDRIMWTFCYGLNNICTIYLVIVEYSFTHSFPKFSPGYIPASARFSSGLIIPLVKKKDLNILLLMKMNTSVFMYISSESNIKFIKLVVLTHLHISFSKISFCFFPPLLIRILW